MNLFDNLFSRRSKRQPENPEKPDTTEMPSPEQPEKPKMKQTEQVLEVMLALAQSMLDAGDANLAAEQYHRILRLCPNATAQYNLASLYAQGKGVAQDFCEGGYYFRQAELSGEKKAGDLVLKCEVDHIRQRIRQENHTELHARMKRFISRVYPEDATETHIGRELAAIGMHLINKKEYADAGKLLRAAAEYCNNGEAQNYLGVLYNAGAGVEQNDLISLYWFDRAADNGIAVAKTDRDGLLDAFRRALRPNEFTEYMEQLAHWCDVGSADVPKTPGKAEDWRRIAKTHSAPIAVSADEPENSANIAQERERMLWRCMQKMAVMIRLKTQPDGTCPEFSIRFTYPGTRNDALLHLETTTVEGVPYVIKVSAIRPDTDMLVSSYKHMGTLEDIVAYLSDRAKVQELVTSCRKVSDLVDEHL